MSATFQRARTSEQRAARQRAILGAARAMLDEMPLGDISLNALSRRVGLAASNVLRYFDSREAILLELVHLETASWLDDLDSALTSNVSPTAELDQRCAGVAAAFAASLCAHPTFCELISAQARVLEHNISPDTAAQFKRTSHRDLARLARLITRSIPELGTDDDSWVSRLASRSILLAGALWAQSRPSASVQSAIADNPDLRSAHVDFETAIQDTFATLAAGTLARFGTRR